MLGFIITLAVIGAVLGLIFSRKGDEEGGFFRGAKKGAKAGCLICLLCVIVIVICIVFIASASA